MVSRAQLTKLGMGRDDVRSEVAGGRWTIRGRVTVQVGPTKPVSQIWWAIFETGTSARVDGVTALQLAGLRNWDSPTTDLVVPHGRTRRQLPGVRIFVERDLEQPSTVTQPPSSDPAYALIRAAMNSDSDRQAATLIAMSVQQQVVAADHLMTVWGQWRLPRRRKSLEPIIKDVCAGAESLGELDFAQMCRDFGLPQPQRQVVCRLPNGRAYLDVRWRCGLVVEIDGAHHFEGTAQVYDALRQNSVVLRTDSVLRIPVIGLRLAGAEFMAQVAQGLRQRGELGRSA